MRDRGELLEWAEVHGNCYGTPREPPVEAPLVSGKDVLFDIDWQGADQVARAMREDRRPHLRAAADDGGTAPRAWNAAPRTRRR